VNRCGRKVENDPYMGHFVYSYLDVPLSDLLTLPHLSSSFTSDLHRILPSPFSCSCLMFSLVILISLLPSSCHRVISPYVASLSLNLSFPYRRLISLSRSCSCPIYCLILLVASGINCPISESSWVNS